MFVVHEVSGTNEVVSNVESQVGTCIATAQPSQSFTIMAKLLVSIVINGAIIVGWLAEVPVEVGIVSGGGVYPSSKPLILIFELLVIAAVVET
jgi:hypothetical protein